MERQLATDDMLTGSLFLAERELTGLLEKLRGYPLDSLENVRARDFICHRASKLSGLIEYITAFLE